MSTQRLFFILAMTLAWFGKDGRAQTVITPPQMGCPASNFPEMMIPMPTGQGFRFQCMPLPPGWSVSGGHIIPFLPKFQTNGADNSSQNVLNIVGGPNCTATNPTGGTVSITCAGGGGGGGTGSYFFTATGSPQSIPASSLGSVNSGVVYCFDAALTGGTSTGYMQPCSWQKDASGNLTVYYSAGVQSIQVMTGSGGGGGGGSSFPAGSHLIVQTATAGIGADSGIAPANVLQSTGSYANPTWLTSLAGSKVTGLGGPCTNQVVTAIGALANPTCTTITSAYVNTSIAKTGVDINTSNQVTATHLAAPLPIAQGGTGSTSPSLVAGSNITITGFWPNQTITAVGGGGGGGGGAYFFSATGSPQSIPSSSFGSSTSPTVWCFDTALSSGNTVGYWTPCSWHKDVGGNLLVYYSSTVQSIQVNTGGSGGGGGGGGGLADPGANGVVYRTALNVTAPATSAQVAGLFTGCSGAVPLLKYDGTCVASVFGTGYTVAASGPTMTITQATHQQGTNPIVTCYSGAPIVFSGNLVATGHEVLCDKQKDASGNGTVVVSWGGTSVGSIQISPGSGTGGGGGGGSMVYPAAGVAVSTGSAWTSSLQVGTSANNLVQLNGSAQLPAVSGANLTALPSTAVLNNAGNAGTASMTLDMHAATTANAFRLPVLAGLTATLNGAIGYDSTNNMLHLGQSGADAFVASFTGTRNNGDCVNWVVVGSVVTLGTTGSACGSGGGGSAFSAITGGTNNIAAMIVGTGASLSASGTGTIAATSVTGFTPGLGTLTGPASNLTLTASGGVLTNSTLGNASTSSAFDHTPTGCTNQWTTGIANNGNLTCRDIDRIAGTLLSGLATGLLKVTTGTGAISVGVAGTDFAPVTSGTSILKGNGAGGFSNVTAADVALLGTLSNSTTGTANVALVANGLSGAYIDWTASSGPTSILNKPSIPTITGGTCTNQVVTAISSSVVPTCTTITSAYVNTSIAITGGDINTSSQVVVTHLTAALPVAQGGTGTTTPGLVAGTGISISGTWPNQTITNTGGGGGGGVTSVSGTSPIASSGGTTPAISCPTCLTTSTTFAGYIKNTSSSMYLYSDIRNYGATCNGTNQHSAVLSALTAGLKELYIPSGCTWVLPTTTWGWGTTVVPGNAIPGGLLIRGQNSADSVIQTNNTSGDVMYVGPQTMLKDLSIPNAGCVVQDPSNGVYGNTTTCPTGILQNGTYRYAGTVTVSGTAVTWASGDKFVTNATGANWMYWGPTYGNTQLVFVINGTQYTVNSVSDATHLTLTSSAGVGTFPFYADQYQANPELRNTVLYINTLGPGDSNGIHVEGNGGDAIYASVHAQLGVAFRGANFDTPAVVFLADRHSNGHGFAVIDSDSSITNAPGFSYDSQTRTSGAMLSLSQGTTTYTGDTINVNMGGGFTGNYFRAQRGGFDRFKVDSYGKLNCKSGGTDAICGLNNMSSGSVSISTTALGPNDSIEMFLETCSNCGTLWISSMSSGSGFTITSSNGADASQVFWRIATRF